MSVSVSINLCCYNSEKYLRETLDSIVEQTYKDWELVIINDGSKDSTESIIHEYIKQGHPIHYHYQENKGLGYSRNKALEYSTGRYIAFIDHDDFWLPEKLQKQISIFMSRPDVDFVYSNYFKKTSYGKDRLSLGLKGPQPEGFIFTDFIYSYLVAISTVIVSKTALDSLESLFDERFGHNEEFDLFMRLLYNHKAAYINEALTVYRIHDDMTTIKSPEMGVNECQFLMEKILMLDSAILKKFPEAMEYLDVQIIKYSRAKHDIMNGRRREARQSIASYKWFSVRLFLTYIATFFPSRLSSFMNQAILLFKRIS